MASICLFETTSTSAAEDIVAAIEAGDLWGVDMGTTSKASSYSKFALVECTANRVLQITDVIPEEISLSITEDDVAGFTDATANEKLWYLRAKL
tara:strand:+ start:891 stop:1172 length:282 start_codon:yes stop_codon:yes gene_type:complete